MIPNEPDIRESWTEILSFNGVNPVIEVSIIEEIPQAIIHARLEKDAEYVGRVDVTINENTLTYNVLELEESFQRNGYYTHLADVSPKWARDRGIDTMQAHAVEGTDSRALFLRTGFEPVDQTYVRVDISQRSNLEAYAESKQ